jgi:hypothetical protein
MGAREESAGMQWTVKCHNDDETITAVVEAKDSLEAVRKARKKHPGYLIGAVKPGDRSYEPRAINVPS